MTENPEQLKELLDSFLDPRSADKALEDIQQGLNLLSTFPDPTPAPQRIALLKREIHLRARKIRRFRRIFRWIGWSACAAAVVVVILFQTPLFRTAPLALRPGSEISCPAPWKIDTEPLLSGFMAHSEEVRSEMYKSYPDLYDADMPNPIEALEQELKMLASSDDFWKG